MTTKITNLILKITITSLLIAILAGCGGVQKSPTQPGWQDKGDGRNGTEGERQNEGSEVGAPEILPGATFEELIQTGKTSLEGGFIKTAAEAFGKAHDDRRESPDAALAYVIAKIVGSPEEFSLLMQPGIEFFFHNTPLIGRWEFLPAPLAEDDSYLLRLASLGTLYGTMGRPTSTSPPVQPPSSTGTPEMPTGTMLDGEGGSTVVPGGGATGEPGPGAGGTITPGEQTSPGGDRTTQMVGQGRGLFQADGFDAQQTPLDGSGGVSDKLQYEGQGTGEQIEYFNFERDIFPALADDYKELARSYSAGYINLDAATSGVSKLKSLVDDLVKTMDSARDSVEDEGFALELPFKLDDKPGVYKIYFKNVDYMIILGYLQLIQCKLEYRSAYNSSNASVMIFTPPADTDNNNVYAPSEYYPASPYGELIEKGDENLANAGSLLESALQTLVDGFDALYNDDRLADFNGNLLVPVNVDDLLIDLIAEERDKYSDYQVLLASGKGSLYFNTTTTNIKAQVDIAYLFGARAPVSVSALLPNLNAATYEPVLTAKSNIFPDPTWGGLFYEGFDNFYVFYAKGNIKGKLTNQGVGIKDVNIAISDSKSTKTDDKGVFTLRDVELNELIGVSVTLTSTDFPMPVKAQIRSFWVLADQQVLTGMMTASDPSGTAEEIAGLTTPGDGLQTETGTPSDGVENPMSKIQKIRDQHEKDKNEGNDEGENGEEEKTGLDDVSG